MCVLAGAHEEHVAALSLGGLPIVHKETGGILDSGIHSYLNLN